MSYVDAYAFDSIGIFDEKNSSNNNDNDYNDRGKYKCRNYHLSDNFVSLQ